MFSKYKFLLISIVLVFMLPISYFLFGNRIIFKMEPYDVYVDVGSDFIVPPISACYGNIFNCKIIDVNITNNVDVSKTGIYSVSYSASYNGSSAKMIRNFEVVDRVNPEIIVDSDLLTVCPNVNEYDVTYSAIDNYDGDITHLVIKDMGTDFLNLSVSDLSGNSVLKTINVKKEDNEAPIITLNGNSDMFVLLNSSFSDPGVNVSDNCDSNLKAVVTGCVDIHKEGVYTLTYSVSDSFGNESSITRNVHVYDSNSFNKTIYLTFDDGPSQYTGELLDILKSYNVKATFFVTGRNSNYDYYITRAYNEGHSIGLHTNTHNYDLIYSSYDAYFNDLDIISRKVKSLTGIDSKILRFPGGSSNTVSRITPGIMTGLSSVVQERGYKYFDWNISSGDASGTLLSSSQYANNVINGLGNSSYYIVLQHDTNINSIRAVSSIIEYGISHGYMFASLSLSSPTVHHKIAN